MKIDNLPEIDACTGTNKFYGKSISIIELKEFKSSLSWIEYRSFRYRGIRKCSPDFDCGNKICVPAETICNGIYDCDTDADEKNCELPEKIDDILTTQVIQIENFTTEIQQIDDNSTILTTSDIAQIEVTYSSLHSMVIFILVILIIIIFFLAHSALS